jgi:uncharacterized protein (UPF0332 family)
LSAERGGSSGLTRARDEIAASRLLAEGGFLLQAVSRAYYAAFYAAEEALRVLGESRSSHAGVIAAFGRRVVRDAGFDERAAQLLSSLFRGRTRADYEVATISREDTEDAIRDAERFVHVVDVWLKSR